MTTLHTTVKSIADHLRQANLALALLSEKQVSKDKAHLLFEKHMREAVAITVGHAILLDLCDELSAIMEMFENNKPLQDIRDEIVATIMQLRKGF